MKKVALMLMLGVTLAGCDSMRKKVGEEVREVEVGQTLVDDGYGANPYVNGQSFDSDEPELYVEIRDVASSATFKVDLGTECSQFPLPAGQRMLVRFDKSASKAQPNDIYMAPQSDQVYKVLCPST